MYRHRQSKGTHALRVRPRRLHAALQVHGDVDLVQTYAIMRHLGRK